MIFGIEFLKKQKKSNFFFILHFDLFHQVLIIHIERAKRNETIKV